MFWIGHKITPLEARITCQKMRRLVIGGRLLQEAANYEQSEDENETPNYRHRDRMGVFTRCGAETCRSLRARHSLLLRSTRFLFRHEVLLYPEVALSFSSTGREKKALTLHCATQSASVSDGLLPETRCRLPHHLQCKSATIASK